MSRNPHAQKSLDVNLADVIPYTLTLANNNESLVLTRGVMQGQIQTDSLLLEFEQEWNIPMKNMVFHQTKSEDMLLTIYDTIDKSTEDIISLFLDIVSRELSLDLVNTDTKKPLIYVTPEMIGGPLIGSMYIGIIDRGTNLLQIRRITGCPLNCPFCSVDEGPTSKTKIFDYLVDPDYLVDTYNQVVKEKRIDKIEAHLDGQGEPMSNPYLVDIIQLLNENPKTKITSIQTNGWYLNEKIIDELASVGLSRINLSLNSMQNKLSKRLAGRGDYNLDFILEMAEYISNSKISLILTRLWIPEWNDEDMEEIIKFSLKINQKEKRYPTLGIQNYLTHDQGRNIKGIKAKTFAVFNDQLREFEKKLGAKDLVLNPHMFEMFKSEMIANPLKIKEIVLAEVVLPGRVENEVIAMAKSRLIHVSDSKLNNYGAKIKVRITRNRHNIFFGKAIKN